MSDSENTCGIDTAIEPAAGNYFVSTFPPFSSWNDQSLKEVRQTLEQPVNELSKTPLGLYFHIPFCSQRCDFCYYRSYAGTSRQVMEQYVSDLLVEIDMLVDKPAIEGRNASFVYFGGGTPSILPEKQIERLCDGIQAVCSWDQTEEITFECAPKTATPEKLKLLRHFGVTRISMGIQQLNDDILKMNGRIHTSDDTRRAYAAIRNESFPTVNVDLIVGLVGESDKTFYDSLDEVIQLGPDSITIYQLEIPPNTPLYKNQIDAAKSIPLPNWETKRKRLDSAFNRLQDSGYKIRSAYAAVRDGDKHQFVYQKSQYCGADLLGIGVASFSYVQGVHYQNLPSLQPYQESIAKRELPICRGYVLSDDERLVRQFILQLKLGSVNKRLFMGEFGIDVCHRFQKPLAVLADKGMLTANSDYICLTRKGLLCVDRILTEFFPEPFRHSSYW